MLVDLCCGEDGHVYACGRNGVLVRGRADLWETMELGGFSDDLWSLVWYKGKLYVATMDHVLTLAHGGLKPLSMGNDAARTCYDLVTGAGLMWSIGAKDVMSFDGKKWTRID